MADEKPGCQHSTDIAAVLFDYGGVLADVLTPSNGFESMAQVIRDHLPFTSLTREDIATDLAFGWKAYDGWKRAQSRARKPREISQQGFWKLVTCDWTDADRAAVAAAAVVLTQELELRVIARPALPGTRKTLLALRDRGIRLALVSNCLSGEAARVQLEEDQLLDLFDVTVFSNEIGYRKPGPQILWHALAALDVEPEQAAFVGDRLDRDMLAGARAGIRLNVLRKTPTGSGVPLRGVTADVTIDHLGELLDRL